MEWKEINKYSPENYIRIPPKEIKPITQEQAKMMLFAPLWGNRENSTPEKRGE